VKVLEVDVKAECRCEKLISFLNYFGIEFVHKKTRSKMRFEKMGAADMVYMTVGEDNVFDLRGVKPRFFDFLDYAVEGKPRAAIDEDRFSQIEQINGAVPWIGHIRTCHAIDEIMYSLLPHRL
jgi:hypothetical protein